MILWLGVSTLFNTLVAAVTGLIVYYKNTQNQTYKAFARYCFFMTIWSFGYFFPWTPDNYTLTLFSFQLLHVGALFIAVAHLDFVAAVVGKREENKIVIWLGYLFNLGVLFVLASDKFITGLAPQGAFPYWAVPGQYYHIWLTVWWLYMLYGISILIRSRRTIQKSESPRIQYLLWTVIISSGFGGMNFLPFYGVAFTPVLTILSSVQIIAFANVIGAYRYPDIKLAGLHIVKFVIQTGVAVGFAWIFLPLLNDWFPWPSEFPWLLVLLLALFSIAFFLIKNNRWIDRIFSIASYEKFETLMRDLTTKHRVYEDRLAMEQHLRHVFVDELYIESSMIYDITDANRRRLRPLLQLYLQGAKLLVTSEVEQIEKNNPTPMPVFQLMRPIGEVLIPLYRTDEFIGAFFVLGHKEMNKSYTIEEIDLIMSVIPHMQLSYSVLNYSKNLKDEVRRKTESLREVTRDLQASYQKLKQLDEAKDTFLAIASHELRTPMTIIKGYSDFLLSGAFGPLNVEQRDFSQKIYDGTKKLLHLINNILDLSRLEADREQFDIRPFSLLELLEETKETYTFACSQRKQTLVTNFDAIGPTWQLTSDKEKVTMMLTNLLGNALKFTPEGGRIDLFVDLLESDEVSISVKDNGLGIPIESQSGLFQKFVQVEGHLKKSTIGSGLGLAIVKQTIEKLGGAIELESARGEGATFRIILPKSGPTGRPRKPTEKK